MSQLKLKEQNKEISFWIDSSGGPKEHCDLSFYGADPKYVIYGSLNEVNLEELTYPRTGPLRPPRLARRESERGSEASEPANRRGKYNVNCFDFLEKKIEEEKHNEKGIFVGYISYDIFNSNDKSIINYPDFFFAYFEKTESIIGALKLETPNSKLETQNPKLETHNLILQSNMTDSEYLEKVRLIKEEIKAGNVYQVNLTREYFISSSELQAPSSDELYLKLREASPSPYSCFFKTPFLTILSSSPEEFLHIKDGFIKTRPIKGTLPKNVFKIDPKNKAENIMIVDLERNDLGRVCEYGSITVKNLLDIESYKHLNHVVSTVHGKLKKNSKLKDIFQALFPGGSITGAPKIAAMKLIDELEPTKRGAYTGSFGYIKTDGTMNFNILIRTIFVQNLTTYHLSLITFNVGGGIVADSDPESELEEIKLKAKGIMDALGIKC